MLVNSFKSNYAAPLAPMFKGNETNIFSNFPDEVLGQAIVDAATRAYSDDRLTASSEKSAQKAGEISNALSSLSKEQCRQIGKILKG